MRAMMVGGVTVVLLVCAAVPVRAAEPAKEPLVEQVDKAINSGVDYLKKQAKDRGNWEHEPARGNVGGATALAVLALLNCGVKADDEVVRQGLEYLRKVPPTQTYVVGLQTMVFALAGQPEDVELIRRNVKWLLDARIGTGNDFVGWAYKSPKESNNPGRPDNSNTQYALLGLHEAHQAGVKVDPEVWQSIRNYYVRSQGEDGGWGYPGPGATSSFTMTTAGLCGLLMAEQNLNAGREIIGVDGTAANCGKYEADRPIVKALDWLGRRFPPRIQDGMDHLYYALYGIERAGRLSGQRFLGEHDWYRVGCEYLVSRQKADGSWMGSDGSRVVSSSFALLFLSKGRTPVLISKLAHTGADWNNDRNDARHLTEFVSRELFKKMPLAWQVFDVQKTNSTPEALLAELLQTPIAYFNGHLSPRFAGVLEGGATPLLRQYVDQGGFIFAEACCGDPRFDKGFRELMAKLFPDAKLEPLPADHPIWVAAGKKFAVRPGDFKLEGITTGCKTVVVYSPQDLSCWWESNQYDRGRGQTAFHLGANIIAYATGLEAPMPRGTTVEVARDDGPDTGGKNVLKVAQLKAGVNSQPPAPKAMRNLMLELEKYGIKVQRATDPLSPTSENVVRYPLLYMHGRNGFTFQPEHLKALRFHLEERRGLLFADACCGSEEFDKAFREFITKLLPEHKLEAIPLDDRLYSAEISGTQIEKVMCRRTKEETEYKDVKPELEGVKIDGRWAVIYSKYDIGCALEKRASGGCRGHDHDSAVLLARAVALYAMKR